MAGSLQMSREEPREEPYEETEDTNGVKIGFMISSRYSGFPYGAKYCSLISQALYISLQPMAKIFCKTKLVSPSMS